MQSHAKMLKGLFSQYKEEKYKIVAKKEIPTDSFLKITYKNKRKLSELISEDETDITGHKRGVNHYAERLAITPQSLIDKISLLSLEKNRKIQLLDAGCGSGVFINELLSNKNLNDYLKSCSGISKSYFSQIESVINLHGNRFNYYYGFAHNILQQLTNRFDLITDICGPLMYCTDKLLLLRLYFNALKKDGVAYLHSSGGITIMNAQRREVLMDIYLCSQFPETFSLRWDEKFRPVLMMKKTSEHFPVPKFTVKSYKNFYTTFKVVSHWAMQIGNGVAPTKVKYIPSDKKNLVSPPKRQRV